MQQAGGSTDGPAAAEADGVPDGALRRRLRRASTITHLLEDTVVPGAGPGRSERPRLAPGERPGARRAATGQEAAGGYSKRSSTGDGMTGAPGSISGGGGGGASSRSGRVRRSSTNNHAGGVTSGEEASTDAGEGFFAKLSHGLSSRAQSVVASAQTSRAVSRRGSFMQRGSDASAHA